MGAQIRTNDPEGEWIDDPANDTIVTLLLGTNDYSRTFTVPQSAGSGFYDARWVILDDTTGTWIDSKTMTRIFEVRTTAGENPTLSVSVLENPDPVNSEQNSQVTVHVTSEGAPVTGASIEVSNTGGTLDQTVGVTDANGDFVTTFTAPSVIFQTQYSISATATKEGYSSESSSDTITVQPVTPVGDTIRVYRTATGQIDVLDIETEYLPYVVAAENYEAPFESMKAQAIASRTYAYYKKEHPSGSNFDLYDNEEDQVYNPNLVLNDNHRRSVSETNGIVLKYNGVIIASFYVSGTDSTAQYVTYNEGKSGDDITQSSIGLVTNPPSLNPYNRGCMGQVQANDLANNGYTWQGILRYFYGEDIIIESIGNVQRQAVITAQSISPTVVSPGGETTFVFNINNPNTESIENVRLGAQIRTNDPEGEWIDDPANDTIVTLLLGTNDYSRTFTVPQSAGSGFYDARWVILDDTTGTWIDSKTMTRIFEVQSEYSVDIISPTQSSPVSAGNYESPSHIGVTVEVKSGDTPIPDLTSDKFSIKIGGLDATATITDSSIAGRYVFDVTPSQQSSPGKYELEVSVSSEGKTQSDKESEAVIYGEGNANVMLVIDRSGSMSGSPITSAKNSANLFVDYMESEDKAGVVSFSSSARYDYHLSTLTPDVKNSIKQKINLISASGGTSIRSGLNYGLNDLLNYGDPNNPWAIVLLSDGKSSDPSSVVSTIQANNIQVYTVGLGSSVDEDLLSDIASQTGGMYYYSPTDSQLQEIYNNIVGKIIGWDTVVIRKIMMFINDVVSIPAIIDSTIEKISFGISWDGSNVDVVLYKPDGSMVDPSVADSDPNIEYVTGPTYKFYRVTDPEPGEWTMELTATDMPAEGEEVTVTVRAASTLSMSLSTDKDQYSQGESVKIITGLSDGETQITTADVEVNITLPDSSIEHLTLYDDGGHGDGEAQDGVYANYFVNTSLKGDYKADATATGNLSDGSQFNRIEDTSFEIIEGISSISISPENLSMEEQAGGQISRNVTVSTSLGSMWITITPTLLQSENSDVIAANDIEINPTSVNVSSGVPENILVTINIPAGATPGNYTGKIVATGANGSDSCTINLRVTKDVVTPVINSVYLSSDSVETGSIINITVNATDNIGVSSVKANDISLLSQGGNLWSGSITALEGIHSVNVSAVDEAGNVVWDNSTSYTTLTSDTEKPVIESVVLFPATTTAGSTINVTVDATDNIEVTEVTAGDVQLAKTDNIWQGSITAPSSIGDYSMLITAKDAAGNAVEITENYKVVAPTGSLGVGISPKVTTASTSGTTIDYTVNIKSIQNFDDIVSIDVIMDGLPASYQISSDWFEWNNQTVNVPANSTVSLPLKLTIPPGQAASRKAFKVRANSTLWITSAYDTGVIAIS
ncbi:hypothetical protein MSSAC_1429 [Methanosarcina siciliae C2J]|uniref:VWFA domain-containing protein n=1 Tax=Methanosarcina siciliae C2J TaxID=1434118 RepID=A0A0E3PM66_9EURY|nr:hypothetical protein MSSAC_1429 [Methanosarcina siciliae C2J]